MELEKEVRFSISKEQIESIRIKTTCYKEEEEMLDITCGYDGFNSLSKYGYICRIRQKGDNKTLEVKKYYNETDCYEQSIKLEKISDGVNFLKFIGMRPYLYLKRLREVRLYKGLKIFIDQFDIIGDYVEIEYQDSVNAKEELNEFITLIGIDGKNQDMYGGIVKDRLLNDQDFRLQFEEGLATALGSRK